MQKRKILIIDDEADFCKLVKKNLELIGEFEVSIATDGRAGIALAKNQKPDLILLDIMMPRMNGFQVLETLKNDLDVTQVPVIMLTALGDDTSKIKAAGLYDEAYITKPVDADDLKAKIEEVLKRKAL